MSKDELISTGIIAAFTIGIFYGSYLIGQAKCEAKSVSFEDHKHTFLGGCMVKHKDKWLPLDNIRGFD